MLKGLLNSQQSESDAYSLSWAQFPCHPGPVNDIVSLSSSIALILCKITSSLHKPSETPNSWKADQNMSVESLALSPQFTVKRCSIGEVGTKNPIWVHPNSLNFQRGPSRTKHLSIKSSSRDGVGDKDGVIIVDHGSRRRESNLMLKQFVAMFREKTGYLIVEPAHMELAEPSIKDAFGSCVQQGANRVIVSPFFLFPGRHWCQDIPSLTAEAAKEHPGVPYIVTAPLGLHEQLVVNNFVLSFARPL
ncbi:hypothetical protein CISIN_1g023828mg [Citrus sinensis]|uniref:Uncharacterized protein n=1 Tax=Citrus sinensis TaxID=2711 RepID=A0A067EMW0_CITSI|nr:hypothetical protein CISIN_1g023828mg [Citrus sinensis]